MTAQQFEHDDEAEERSPNLLTLSMGLVFWSVCTALSITGLMRKSGVAAVTAGLSSVISPPRTTN